METTWYILTAMMLTAYAVLDGFDLGAGMLHLVIARTDAERRQVLASVGPVWDGNEVWLIAAGGTLFFAFPLLYASSFSGFYLPLNMVLWLLMFRAIGVEFRTHLEAPVWRDFFDVAFSLASLLLAVFFGAALGNVIRGVPLRPDHFFFEPLWTNWRVGADNGILDWYTAGCAVLTVFALAMHGAAYLALKNEGEVQSRARLITGLTLAPVLLLALAGILATVRIRPEWLANYLQHPATFLIPTAAAVSFLAIVYYWWREQDFRMFMGSCCFIVSMLAGIVCALYPRVLPASTGDHLSLTVYNSATGHYSLRLGLYWWTLGIAIAIAYFVMVYRMFRGKVVVGSYGHD